MTYIPNESMIMKNSDDAPQTPDRSAAQAELRRLLLDTTESPDPNAVAVKPKTNALPLHRTFSGDKFPGTDDIACCGDGDDEEKCLETLFNLPEEFGLPGLMLQEPSPTTSLKEKLYRTKAVALTPSPNLDCGRRSRSVPRKGNAIQPGNKRSASATPPQPSKARKRLTMTAGRSPSAVAEMSPGRRAKQPAKTSPVGSGQRATSARSRGGGKARMQLVLKQ